MQAIPTITISRDHLVAFSNLVANLAAGAIAQVLHRRGLVSAGFPGTARHGRRVLSESVPLMEAYGWSADVAAPWSAEKCATAANYWYRRAIIARELAVAS